MPRIASIKVNTDTTNNYIDPNDVRTWLGQKAYYKNSKDGYYRHLVREIIAIRSNEDPRYKSSEACFYAVFAGGGQIATTLNGTHPYDSAWDITLVTDDDNDDNNDNNGSKE